MTNVGTIRSETAVRMSRTISQCRPSPSSASVKKTKKSSWQSVLRRQQHLRISSISARFQIRTQTWGVSQRTYSGSKRSEERDILLEILQSKTASVKNATMLGKERETLRSTRLKTLTWPAYVLTGYGDLRVCQEVRGERSNYQTKNKNHS